MKRSFCIILSLIFILQCSMLISSAAEITVDDQHNALIESLHIDEELCPYSLTNAICEDCGGIAPLRCAGTRLVYSENSLGTHVVKINANGELDDNGEYTATCSRVQLVSYSKYICYSCGWNEYRFVDEDPSQGIARHYCDIAHFYCDDEFMCNLSVEYDP